MEYRSPLGYNFKLEQSLSNVADEKNNETPSRHESPDIDSSFISLNNSSSGQNHRNKRPFNHGRDRNSSFSGSSPRPGKSSRESRSSYHRHSNHDYSSVNIAQYFHPSMLEDPWKELEAKAKQAQS